MPSVAAIPCPRLRELLAEALVVDVRSSDWFGGHVPGSVRCPAGAPARDEDWAAALAAAAGHVRPGAARVVFCSLHSDARASARAALYATALAAPGCEVATLDGGVHAWVNYARSCGALAELVADFDAQQWAEGPGGELRHVEDFAAPAPAPPEGAEPGLVLVRHGHRLDYCERDTGRNWIPTAQRPWDPPLTAVGYMQAEAAGRRIAAEHAAWRLRRPVRVFCSPFFRCVLSACGLARACGAESIRIEPGMAERMDEKWHRSWAVPGATSKYGGPPGCKCGVQVDPADLHPCAMQSPAEWLLSAPQLRRDAGDWECAHGLPDGAALIDAGHQPCEPPPSDIRWGSWDSAERCVQRQRRTIDALRAKHPGETLLFVGHGGPLRQLTGALLGREVPKETHEGGYCAIYAHRPAAGGAWEAALLGCDAHSASIADLCASPAASPTRPRGSAA
eukprot:TRINITY_DN34651_c0_g1_i1.p1 TRINITY_DN34651_c0_g1~~TRINITY_DN34651_c0_g1_i1.p1  ORF type:complete len:450 (+),score=101.23 TRINITY_DN34651_c0_g1_i1:71-1420(+)